MYLGECEGLTGKEGMGHSRQKELRTSQAYQSQAGESDVKSHLQFHGEFKKLYKWLWRFPENCVLEKELFPGWGGGSAVKQSL